MKKIFSMFTLCVVTSMLVIALTSCGSSGSDEDGAEDVIVTDDASDGSSDTDDTDAGDTAAGDTDAGTGTDATADSGSQDSGEPTTVDIGKDSGYVMDVPAGFKYNEDIGYRLNAYSDPSFHTKDMTFYKTEKDLNDGIASFNIDYKDGTVGDYTVKINDTSSFYGKETQYFIKLDGADDYGCRIMVTHESSIDETQSKTILDALKTIRKK